MATEACKVPVPLHIRGKGRILARAQRQVATSCFLHAAFSSNHSAGLRWCCRSKMFSPQRRRHGRDRLCSKSRKPMPHRVQTSASASSTLLANLVSMRRRSLAASTRTNFFSRPPVAESLSTITTMTDGSTSSWLTELDSKGSRRAASQRLTCSRTIATALLPM